jgi:hypothetical protein
MASSIPAESLSLTELLKTNIYEKIINLPGDVRHFNLLV